MRAKIEMPTNCEKCARRIGNKCIAYKSFIIKCSSYTSNRKKVIEGLQAALRFNTGLNNYKAMKDLEFTIMKIEEEERKQILEAYNEDKRRGSGGGASDSDSNNKTSIKAKMKDNRALETKSTQAQRDEYTKTLRDWEKKFGPLERLRPDDGMTRSKIDSYTGEEIK